MKARRRRILAAAAVVLFIASASGLASAAPQQQPGPPPVPEREAAPGVSAERAAISSLARSSEPAAADQAAPLVYENRTITVLRARVLGRLPADRASAAVSRLEDLVARHQAGAVRRRLVEGLVAIRVGETDVFAIVPADVDDLAGETLDEKSREAATQLGRALDEAGEARSPRLLLRGALAALAATAVFLLLLWSLRRVQGRAWAWLSAKAQSQLDRQLQTHASSARLASELRALDLTRRVVDVTALGLALLLSYSWLTWVLERFPYTRPWGEALGGFLVSRVLLLGDGLLRAVPGLFTVALIFLLTRLAVRLAGLLFEAVEKERLTLPWLYPDTALPTRRLVTVLLWAVALVASYPYLPGSESAAFKGVSVLFGLMISLGSSGFVNQVMSSFVITYSRSLRTGDWARIGDVEGSVVQLGILSTKIRTLRNEEVTLPNAMVASKTVTNFSRHAREGLYVQTSVTIGYDTPWRQVEALLLLAAEGTPGLRSEPRPFVLQTALQDFYVAYVLHVCVDRPERYPFVLNDLNARIQDNFNTYGVQIMSPGYRSDPAAPKIVPREQWFAAPARADGAASSEKS